MVVWRYTEEEWAAYDAREWARDRRKAGTAFALVCAIAVIFGLIIAAMSYPSGPVCFGLAPLILWGVPFGWIYRAEYKNAAGLHQARLVGPRQIRITPQGLHVAGAVVPLAPRIPLFSFAGFLSESPLQVHWVAVTNGAPPELCLRGYRGRRRDELCVPVPRGYEAEAGPVAERLRRELLRPR
jgi:hypothetical protein